MINQLASMMNTSFQDTIRAGGFYDRMSQKDEFSPEEKSKNYENYD